MPRGSGAAGAGSLSDGLRPHRHRLRPRRLCLRDPRGAARPEDRGGREDADLWRHLPQHRLYPLKGAAACLGDVQRGRPCFCENGHRHSGAEARIADHAEVQAGCDRRQREGRRLPVQEEQGRRLSRHRAYRCGRQGRGEGRRRQDPDARNQDHRHRHRLGCRAAQRHRDRREARRVLDRRAVARQGARASCWWSAPA